MSLISEMPELGNMTAKQVSSLIGLAPGAQDSGMYRGRRKIKVGRRGPEWHFIWRQLPHCVSTKTWQNFTLDTKKM